MEDKVTIEKLKNGDELAFRKLVENYQGMVVNTCFGLIQNTHDAEDVAQEVFIEVFRSVNHFRSDARLSTWLYRIAVNKSLNFIRDNKRRKYFHSIENMFTGKSSDDVDDPTVSSDQPETGIEDEQRSKLLHDSINALPENQRIAFTLNKYEDLPYQQIAEVMETSLSSVESLIHRAKKNLQKKLYKCYKKKCI